jgi:hypothetical protein
MSIPRWSSRSRWLVLGVIVLNSVLSARPAPAAEVTDKHRKLAQEVLDRLVAVAVRPEGYDAWPPTIDVIAQDQPNAFASLDDNARINEGKRVPIIVVHTGEIERVAEFDPDALSLTLGHEMGHHVLGHVLNKAKTGDLAQLAFNRQDEIDADLYGMELALKAGYSYKGALKNLQNTLRNSLGYSSFEGLAEGYNHPPWKDRIALLEQDEPRQQLWRSMSAFDNGVFLLLVEQYKNAEFCFLRVTREFPDCYEAWANLGYARLMLYCDALDPDDLKFFDIGHLVVGAFYRRAESLDSKVRGIEEKLWYDAVGALREALRLKPDLILAKANLAVAHLVHPSGQKDVGTAARLFDEVALALEDEEQTRTLEPLTRLSLMINTGVARLGAGQSDASDAIFNAVMQDIANLKRSNAIGAESSALEGAVTYNRALALASSSEPADQKSAVSLFEEYLAHASSAAAWWPVAYERYSKMCTDLGLTAKPEDELAASAPNTCRQITSVVTLQNATVSLSSKIRDLKAELGEAEVAIPVIAGTNLKRYQYPQHGITVLGAGDVVAIFLTDEHAPPLQVRREGLGSEITELRVGMPKADFEKLLGTDRPFGTIDNAEIAYRFYFDIGVAVMFRGGKVAELVVAPLPRAGGAK